MSSSAVGARAVLKRNGKSFWFASLFLPKETASDVARLYAFCRALDDLADAVADDSDSRIAAATLQGVRDDLRRDESRNPLVADFLELAHRFHLPLDAADYLLGAFLEDATTNTQVADEQRLLRYCYGVAGTVGLMMAPLLGAKDMRATRPAVDLGIAMQMTNIARDVLEDARNGRRYLPGSWVSNVEPATIVADPSCRQQVGLAIERLLHLADVYYARAVLGFPFLPPKARRTIEIAGTVYREIGVRIRDNHFRWWSGRIYVPLWRKAAIAAGICLGQSRLAKLAVHAEPDQLDQTLAGLPGTS
jgi:phytoene synthase